MEEKKKDLSEEDLDKLLDQAFAQQDQIQHKCKIRDDPERKQKEWEEKYRK